MYLRLWLKKSITYKEFFSLITYFSTVWATDARLIKGNLMQFQRKKMKNSFQHHNLKIMGQIVCLMKFLSKLISKSQNGIMAPKLCSCMTIRNRHNNATPSLKYVIRSSDAKTVLGIGQGLWCKILSPVHSHHLGMWNQFSDGWKDREINGKTDRQIDRLTERLMKVIAKKTTSNYLWFETYLVSVAQII